MSDATSAPRGRGRVSDVDVVVIGAGAMGSATAWHLARAGRSVIVLEQHSAGHHLGASHGSTRNLSAAYPTDTYQDLLTETRALWRELEAESGTTLIDGVGVVQHGGELAELQQLREVHERRGVRSELISAGEARARWRGLRFETSVLHTLDAGRVRAADALRVLRERAEAHGAEFRYATPVRGLVDGAAGPIVTTDAEELRPAQVVLTAGAWTTDLAPASLAAALPPLRVTQEQPAHFAARAASGAVADGSDFVWPGFMQRPEPGERDAWMLSPTYGMLTPGEGVKVGWHGVGAEVHPDRRDFAAEPVQMDALRRYVREWIPGADPDHFVPISCTYTTTPTEDFVLDRRGAVTVGAGFSGHGFKFTPVIGRILADVTRGIPAPEVFRLPA
ncbi:FAD-dependent oxidoreductase [Schumannella sp. 10F1B-5-1]|uniref:FAD-dependent oxidoreductase n=1 Tax=Schumannella sp. 10F1B-5-1 TaxID=2590780 RepID=UPI0011311FB7|nr:FAD-dependent oxidoreductase [Schumannella sp. 10F1B-5-1]TPW73025.1 FAD-dependent oxidoreductase [Schumannella sp. 10F1B-5-1]